ncbi:MAG: hypothetical protein HQM16_11295 [Deltaproteobacteria bacterium]|nr:hypothetical protein [Deltaproteobacteria bacterium]
MRKISAVLLIVLGLFYINNAYAEVTKFESKEGGFVVMAPAVLTASSQVEPTAVGDLKMNMFTGEKPDGTAYVVMYIDYPPEMIKLTDPQVMLDGAKTGALENTGGKLISEKVVSLDGHPGRIVAVAVNKGTEEGVIKTHLYLVNNRLYQIMAAGLKKNIETKEVEDYLSSFKLVK